VVRCVVIARAAIRGSVRRGREGVSRVPVAPRFSTRRHWWAEGTRLAKVMENRIQIRGGTQGRRDGGRKMVG
jgi:hypothetical protein